MLIKDFLMAENNLLDLVSIDPTTKLKVVLTQNQPANATNLTSEVRQQSQSATSLNATDARNPIGYVIIVVDTKADGSGTPPIQAISSSNVPQQSSLPRRSAFGITAQDEPEEPLTQKFVIPLYSDDGSVEINNNQVVIPMGDDQEVKFTIDEEGNPTIV